MNLTVFQRFNSRDASILLLRPNPSTTTSRHARTPQLPTRYQPRTTKRPASHPIPSRAHQNKAPHTTHLTNHKATTRRPAAALACTQSPPNAHLQPAAPSHPTPAPIRTSHKKPATPIWEPHDSPVLFACRSLARLLVRRSGADREARGVWAPLDLSATDDCADGPNGAVLRASGASSMCACYGALRARERD